ncbi:MAG: hypothetical protein ACLR5S_02705 [Ruminococcus sp.]
MTFDSEEGKRHSGTHLTCWRGQSSICIRAKLAIGPAIDTGFCHQFDVEHPFSQEELTKIEAEMKKIVKANEKLEQFYVAGRGCGKAERDG